jgi:hypothetical protein
MAFSGCLCVAVRFDALGCGFGFIVVACCLEGIVESAACRYKALATDRLWG